MGYGKPDVTALGDALRAIQLVGKGCCNFEGMGPRPENPAYDLDE